MYNNKNNSNHAADSVKSVVEKIFGGSIVILFVGICAYAILLVLMQAI